MHSCTRTLRPPRPPPPAFGLIYEGALFTARTCTAILSNSWGGTGWDRVGLSLHRSQLFWLCVHLFPSIQWPHTRLTTIYRRSWAALRGWDPPPMTDPICSLIRGFISQLYDRRHLFVTPWMYIVQCSICSPSPWISACQPKIIILNLQYFNLTLKSSKHRGGLVGVYSMNKPVGARKMLITRASAASWVRRCSAPSEYPVLG